MISLGEYDGHILVVNRSNVEPNMVTYQVYKDGKQVSMAREDSIYLGMDGAGYRDEHLFEEAERRYNEMGRPEVGFWDGDMLRALGIWTEEVKSE